LSVLTPQLEILPEALRRHWPSLAGLAGAGFVRYGGTAIAPRCGHRVSEDFADGDLAELGLSERRQREQAVLAVEAIPSLERSGEQLVPSANLS
jgi:hypothetical protein